MKQINKIIQISGFSIIGSCLLYSIGRVTSILFLEIAGVVGNLIAGSVFCAFLFYGFLRFYIKDE